MPSFENLAYFFTDFAQDASWTPSTGVAAQPGKVIVDAPDSMILGDMVITTETTLTYPLGQWPGIDENQVVTVGAVTYRLRGRPQAFDDGSLLRVEVVKV